MKPITILFCCLISLNAVGQDLNSARKLINSQQFEEAEKMLEELISKDPTNGNTYYYYGEALLKDYLSDTLSNSMDEYAKKAETIFRTGIEKAPSNVLNQIGMGAVTLLRTSDTTKADEYFKKAVLVVPENLKKRDYTPELANILTNLAAAQMYGKKNRFKKAITYCERAKIINPADPNIYLTLGDIYIKKNNDVSNALVNYNQALNKDPSLPLPKIKIGNIYMRVPNLDAARPYFEEAKEIDSTFAPVYTSLGELWTKAGRHDLARQHYYKYVQLSGNTTPAKIRYAHSLFRSNNYSDALVLIEEILKVDNSRNYLNRLAGFSAYEMKPPDLEKARMYMETFFKNAKPENIIARDYSYYGRILFKTANKDSIQLDKAFENLKKAYSIDEGDRALLAEIASNYYYSRRYSEAIEMFKLKKEKGWEDRADPIMIARSYYYLEDFAQSEKAFTDLIAVDPKNIDAYLWRARAVSKLDPDLEEGLAAPQFEQMVTAIGTETEKNKVPLQEAYSYFGYYNITKKDYDVAKEWYDKMYALDPNNKKWQIDALTGFALIAYKEKDYVEARDNYQKILALQPNNPTAEQAIKDLTKVIQAQK